jgi:hypothetical protein
MKRLLFVLMGSVLTGCGTGAYDSLYSAHLKEIELASQFGVLYPGSTEITGSNLVIRLPKMMNQAYNKNSIYSFDANGEIDPERLNPPFLNPFPGLVNCYEAFVKDPAGDNLPFYLYTGIRPLSPEGKAGLKQELLGKLKALAADASLEDVEALTPQGAKIVWKKIAIAMPQLFFPSGQGRMGAKMLDGSFELWLYEAPTSLVLLGWRAPQTVAGTINLSNLAKLTAGTLHVRPEEPKPAEPPPAGQAPPDAKNAPAP